jgi:hypothetical protein
MSLVGSRTLLGAALMSLALVGCEPRGQRGIPVTGRPLLSASEAIDLFRVSEAVRAREAKHGFRALSDAERVFLCVWNLEAEINNGGFAQFFDNSAGDHATETPAALRRVGATEMAALVERAMTPFGPSGPPADRDERWKAIAALPESARESWSDLDGAFYELPSAEAGLREFVAAHRADFYAAD